MSQYLNTFKFIFYILSLANTMRANPQSQWPAGQFTRNA